MEKEEKKTFAKLLGPVKRIEHDTVELRGLREPTMSRKSAQSRAAVEMNLVVDDSDNDTGTTSFGDETDYYRPGVQKLLLRKLKRGRFLVQSELDLHGITLAEAKNCMNAFLENALARQLLCVRIIHGKGLNSLGKAPVLKPKVRTWLRRHRDVLAYSETRQADGGSGALYVLLRRRRPVN